MKSHRFMQLLVLISLSSMALAQSDGQNSFDKLKALAGSWEGVVTTDPPQPDVNGKPAHVLLHVTSSGHAIAHEATSPNRPDDPLTVVYLDGDRLLLTHHCDSGNRPRMVGKISPDGKTPQFDFLDVVGPMQYGHMHHGAFTFIDANHHSEDWIYMMPGDRPMHAHFDLHRTN